MRRREWLIRSGRLALVSLLIFNGFSQTAFGFKQKYHEQLTEATLQGQGFDEDSADEAGDANYWTDVFEANSDAAHADNNMLGAASERLRNKQTRIGDILNTCKRREALEELGRALHTVQDVYSHSNSVDNVIPIPNLLNMANGAAACAPPAFAPGGLVTGYFNLFGFLTGNQCRGIPANMCCHFDLNKDDPGVSNGARHAPALAAAGGATQTYIQLLEQDFQARFGQDQARQLSKRLKRQQRTTFFVIDDTGSMGDDIDGVRASVNQLLDQIVAGDEAPTLGLVTFKDDVSDFGVTCDIEELRNLINGLFADGGGDCPEASNSALRAALKHFPLINTDKQARGGRILLATDASAGDAHLGPLVSAEALLRGVNIDAILTGDCAEEELAAGLASISARSENEPAAPKASLLVATDSADPLTSPSARTQLRALTEETGGVLFNVERVEVDDVVPTLLELGEPDSAILFSRKVQLQAGTPYLVEIPVDDTLRDKVSFMVTASRSGELPAFTLKRPSGAVAVATDSDVAHLALSSVESYAITAPSVGRWQVQLEGEGSFVLRAFGGTPFRINGLRLQTSAEGLLRPEAELMPVDGQPVAGADLIADLRFTAVPSSLSLTLRRLDGSAIEELAASSPDGDRRFRSALTVPNEIFVLEATGLTPGGSEFVRQTAFPINPQTVSVLASPREIVASPGSIAVIDVEVRNLGAAEASFHLSTTSSLGWPVSGPATVTVGSGASARLELTVQVPASAVEEQRNDVTLLVEHADTPRVRNNAVVTVVAGSANRPPVCTGTSPSAASLWPPNHKLAEIRIGGVSDSDGDGVQISISGITQDEPVLERGNGNTAPDGEGLGTPLARVRAERSGQGDGRVYAIQFTASDGKGGSCNGAVRVEVPHDRGKTAIDSGQIYDSTASKQ